MSSSSFPIITLTFDDGHITHYKYANQIMKWHKIPGTEYIIVNQIQKSGAMNLQQIRDLQNNYGWEIGSHTMSHNYNWLNWPKEKKIREIVNSKKILRSHGLRVESFCYPFSKYTTSVHQIVSKHYSTFVGTPYYQKGDRPVMNANKSLSSIGSRSLIAPISRGYFPNASKTISEMYKSPLDRYTILKDTSVKDILDTIDHNVRLNGWLIINFHSITPTPTVTYEYDLYKFRTIIYYLAKLEKEKKLKVLNISKACKIRNNK